MADAGGDNNLRLEPYETTFDSTAERISITKFLENVERRASTNANVIEHQNIGEVASIELSVVVGCFDPFIEAILFVEPEPAGLASSGGAHSYIHFGDVTVDSEVLEMGVLVEQVGSGFATGKVNLCVIKIMPSFH